VKTLQEKTLSQPFAAHNKIQGAEGGYLVPQKKVGHFYYQLLTSNCRLSRTARVLGGMSGSSREHDQGPRMLFLTGAVVACRSYQMQLISRGGSTTFLTDYQRQCRSHSRLWSMQIPRMVAAGQYCSWLKLVLYLNGTEYPFT